MSKDFSLILTCTINPGDMPNLVRSNIDNRLEDYKKSFNFWVENDFIKKLIFIENSNYNLNYFKNICKNITDKKIEIISSNSNNTFNKELGKGYGQYLCLKEVFEKSVIAKETDYFVDVTGRHCVKNFDKIIRHIFNCKSDIYVNITNNLKFIRKNGI